MPPAPIATEEPVVLTDLVWRVTAGNPGMMTGPGTNTYVVGGDVLAVIDPGPADEAHLDAIVRAATRRGGRIRWILATHTHPDHAPGAKPLAARTGATVLGWDSRDGFEPDRPLADGERVDGGGFVLRAIHTPGHASNHLCYLLEGEELLFSGDHVMQGSTVVISPPDGDMAAYFASLRRVRNLAPAAIAPGHGTLIDDPGAAVDEYLSHRQAREGQVLEALAAGDTTVDEIVARLYAEVPAMLHPVARHSVFAHLRKLVDDCAATGSSIDGVWARR